MPQSSTPVRAESPAGGAVLQPPTKEAGQQPKDLGAFATPQPSKKAVSSAISSAGTVPESTPQSVALNPSTGKTQASAAQVSIPDVNWTKPTVVSPAKSTGSKAGWQSAVATFVADGDTSTMRLGDGSDVVCRIDGIDAPETAKPKYGKPGQPYGNESKSKLQQLIENKEVSVKISYPKQGKNYDRALCQIEFEGADVSKTMIQEGMAWVYEKYAKDRSLKPLEDEARKNRVGLWKDPEPLKPSIFRRSLDK